MSKLNIGWSEISITPDKRVSLLGQFAERISEYVEKPLTATALAIEADGEQMVMVSCDLAHIASHLLADIRSVLRENTVGLDPEKVIYCAIHTHTGPEFSGGFRSNTCNILLERMQEFMLPGQKYVQKVNITSNPDIATDEEVYDMLVRNLSQVAVDAWNARRPGKFTNAFNRAPVGLCRRASYSDGSAQMWGDTYTAVFEALEGGNDSGIELLYLWNEDDKLTGVLATVACPAQCVQHRMFVSPDYWGETKMLLRRYFGEDLYLLGLCSIAGDQCPVDLVRWVEPESDLNDPNCTRGFVPKRKADPSMFDLAGMRKAGKRVANAIIEAWEEGLEPPQEDPVFEHRVCHMQLPLRRATLTDVAQAKEGIRSYLHQKTGDVDYNDIANLQVHLGVLMRAQQQETMNVLDSEIHVIRLGSVAIATNPFEPFLDYGNRIKARSAAEQTFLVQLANGSFDYIPTAKAEKAGHYSAFISSGKVGHEGGEQMVRQTLENIRQMF